MRLARFSENGGAPRLGVIEGEEIVDLTPALGREVRAEQLLELGSGGLERAMAAMKTGPRTALEAVRLQAPIARPPKFFAIGLNYDEHSAEAKKVGMDKPDAMVVFNKQSTCITGPFDPIAKPRVSDQLDYEGELAFVIGRRCRNVAIAEAAGVIAGYLIVNDVSVRDWQRATPTMTLGKSWDTHGPSGPWITTVDEIDDPHALDLKTWVNGELRQDSNTRYLVHNCFQQIAHISQVCTLEPGDIIATGTPAGVGLAMDPPQMLEVGDLVRIEIEGLGAIENPVVDDGVDGRAITDPV